MEKGTAQLGFYSALVAFLAASGYSIVQVLQMVGLLKYPLDAILIYAFSLAIAPPFLLAVLALHYTASNRKIWSHAALLFAVMYTTFVVLNYVVPLSVVIPGLLQAPSDIVLAQTPHSLFWTVDGLGYICMGIATLFAALVFAQQGSERWLRRVLFANGLFTPVIALVYFYPHFSIGLLLIASPWAVTAPGSLLLLALYFRKMSSEE
jgi:uncharacterized membrane protein YpjA